MKNVRYSVITVLTFMQTSLAMPNGDRKDQGGPRY
jgi:hypothetical protein